MNSENGSRNRRLILGHRRPAFLDFFLMNASLVWLRSIVGPCSANGIVDAVTAEEFLLCSTCATLISEGIEPGEGGVGGISFTVSMLYGLNDGFNVIEGCLALVSLDCDIDIGAQMRALMTKTTSIEYSWWLSCHRSCTPRYPRDDRQHPSRSRIAPRSS